MSGELHWPAVARLLAKGPASIVDRKDWRGVQGWWEPAALCLREIGFARQLESVSLYRGVGRYGGHVLLRKFLGECPGGMADGNFSINYCMSSECDYIFGCDEVLMVLASASTARPPQVNADCAEFLTVEWPVDVFKITVNWERSLNFLASAAYEALVTRVSQQSCERLGVCGHLERFRLTVLGQQCYWTPQETDSFSQFLMAIEEELDDQ